MPAVPVTNKPCTSGLFPTEQQQLWRVAHQLAGQLVLPSVCTVCLCVCMYRTSLQLQCRRMPSQQQAAACVQCSRSYLSISPGWRAHVHFCGTCRLELSVSLNSGVGVLFHGYCLALPLWSDEPVAVDCAGLRKQKERAHPSDRFSALCSLE